MSLEFPSLLVENYMSPKLMFTDWQIYIVVYIFPLLYRETYLV